MHVYVRGGPDIMTSPGLAVPEEPHQPLSSKAAIWANSAHIAALET